MKRFDVVLVLALLGASFFAGLQAWNLHKASKIGINKVVGKVSSLKGEAFRKGDADFFYLRASDGLDVAENDQFTTGIKSEAQIQLDQMQSQIVLKEMSHIILKFHKDSFALDIRSGDVEALIAPGEIILVDGNKTLSAKGGPARVRYNKGLDGATFKVLEGEVVVTEGAVQSVVTPKGTSNTLAEIQLQLPEDNAAVVNANREVSFAWATAKDLGPYTLKVFAQDRLIQSREVKELVAVVKLPATGNYTWTVQAAQAKNTVLPNYSFALYEKVLIEIESPLAGKEFILKTEVSEQVVSFKWRQQLLENANVLVEKLLSANERQTFLKENISTQAENNFEKNIPAGDFRWRVEVGKNVSAWNEFRVKKEEVKVAQPTPTPKPVVKIKPKNVPTASPAAPPPAPEVAATPTIVAPAAEKNSTAEETKTSWNGIEIPKIVSPDSGSKIITKEDVVSVDVRARSVACNDYEMEIDTAKNFSNPTILKSENGKGRAQLKAASYFIRARCWKDGDMGEWSLVREFQIEKN